MKLRTEFLITSDLKDLEAVNPEMAAAVFANCNVKWLPAQKDQQAPAESPLFDASRQPQGGRQGTAEVATNTKAL